MDCGDVPLASPCHAMFHTTAAGVWLSDASVHGTLALEAGSSITWDVLSITPKELDSLAWCEAQMLTDQAAVQLGTGQPTTWLVIVGLHRHYWLAGARNSMSAEIKANRAVLLMFEQYSSCSAASTSQAAGALEAVQLGAGLNHLPFARTPGSAADNGQLHRNDRQPRHARIRDKYGDKRHLVPAPARPHQAFNIFQAAATAAAASDAVRSKPNRHQQGHKAKRAAGKAKRTKKRSSLAPGPPGSRAEQLACKVSDAPIKRQAQTLRHAESAAAKKENEATAEAVVHRVAGGGAPTSRKPPTDTARTQRAAGKQRRKQVLGRMGLR